MARGLTLPPPGPRLVQTLFPAWTVLTLLAHSKADSNTSQVLQLIVRSSSRYRTPHATLQLSQHRTAHTDLPYDQFVKNGVGTYFPCGAFVQNVSASSLVLNLGVTRLFPVALLQLPAVLLSCIIRVPPASRIPQTHNAFDDVMIFHRKSIKRMSPPSSLRL